MRGSGALALALMLPLLAAGCSSGGIASDRSAEPREVVVYTSVDQVFAEPALKDFEKRTGIKVRAVYDAEVAKTTGLVNRLIAEKGRPRADVWWSGETVQTLKLAEQGVLASYRSPAAASISAGLQGPDGLWTGFGGRARVFVYNTRSKAPAPDSLADLARPKPGTDPRRVGMSSPLFGTTSTQAAVLYSLWGRSRAREFFAGIPASGVRVLAGAADVRDKVVSGELDWGLVDTDDALGALAKGAPVRIIVPDQSAGQLGGALLIPNTVGLVAGGPHAENGRRLVDYLLSADTERRLVESEWIQFPVRGAPDARIATGTISFMQVDWPAVYGQLDRSSIDMKEIFLR